jgi:two-component system, OmpR family, phosphate regulon sensor histidine kinase PhoR
VVNDDSLRIAAQRGRILVEESREVVLVLDSERRVLAASRRAREELPSVEPGEPVPEELLLPDGIHQPLLVPYEVDGSRETLVYLGLPGEMRAYEELRAGFTAAVSHELRTPLARLMALLETALLPGEDPRPLVEQATAQVELVGELIDEVLFLSELETGREVVALGEVGVRQVLDEVAAGLAERAVRADVQIIVEGDPAIVLPMRPRMLRVVAENLAENGIRYAGPRATLTLGIASERGLTILRAADTGAGVSEQDLPRLFERFYRADRARASRGTGLGLAIVKHIVTAAGGEVEASSAPGRGLEIRCVFATTT